MSLSRSFMRRAIKEVDSMVQLSQRLYLSPLMIIKISESFGIKLLFDDLDGWKDVRVIPDPDRDELILSGRHNPRELGKLPKFGNISRAGVERYVRRRNLTKKYHEARKSFKTKRKYDLGNLIRGVCNHKAKEGLSDVEQIALDMAFESADNSSQGPEMDFWKKMEIYKMYCEAILEDRKPNLNEIARGIPGVYASAVSRALKRVGEYIRGTRTRRSCLSEEEIALIERVYGTELSCKFLESLTGIAWHIFGQRFRRMSKRRIEFTKKFGHYDVLIARYIPNQKFKIWGRRKTKPIRSFGCCGDVNDELASRIYEAHDLSEETKKGWSKEDVMELLNIKHEMVYDYAVEHRGEIEPEIVSGLRKLFPDIHKSRGVNKPYVDWR